jgi:hypothetical protein
MLSHPKIFISVTVKTEKIIVWTDSFLNAATEPQKDPTALPHSANHMLSEDILTILESVP